ncbi:MAG: hypothetical protein LUO93_02020 [Methanomicrobiales archaeon]|nr:hypothetical protein [Methanomicrobiales archaeon]
MSKPISLIASTVNRLTFEARVPALNLSKRSPWRAFGYPSAIWDRPALWLQIKSTRLRAKKFLLYHTMERY